MNNAFNFEEQPFEAYAEFEPENVESELTGQEWEKEMWRGRHRHSQGMNPYRQPRYPQGPMRHHPSPPRRFVWEYSPSPLLVDPRVEGESASCTCPSHGTEFIRWVQSSLNQVLGLWLPVTGDMNVATRSALRRFQQQYGLTADGIAGPETERALVEAKRSDREQTGDLTDSAEYEELVPGVQKKLKEFLDMIRKRPQDFKKLLLVARLHPFPKSSLIIGGTPVPGFPVPTQSTALYDLIAMADFNADQLYDQVLAELKQIADRNFRQEITAAEKLWAETVDTVRKLNPKKLKPYLLQAALLLPAGGIKRLQTNSVQLVLEFRKLGFYLADTALNQLGKQIIASEADDAHLTELGWVLAKDADALQNRNPTFKREVDEERRRSQQWQRQQKSTQQGRKSM